MDQDTNTSPPKANRNSPHPSLPWRAQVITLFPEAFPGVLAHSLTGKALISRLWEIELIALRDFGVGKHKNVDDTPAGGGAGMVLKPDVIAAALDHAAKSHSETPETWPVIALSPRGRPFTQSCAQRYAHAKGVTLLCGRFEGIDQRIFDHYPIKEVSMGDFILSGGEIAAQALIDATVRLIPRVLGNAESVLEESFSNSLLEHPQYTRPADWNGRQIPDVLLSGHHAEIAKWRVSQSKSLTQKRRPDLWRAYLKDRDPDEDQEL